MGATQLALEHSVQPRSPAQFEQSVRRLTESQRELVEENIGLAYGAFIKYQSKRLLFFVDEDDLVQIASLALCNAAIRYIPGKAVFSTYAYKAIRNAFADTIRLYMKKSRIENVYEMCSYEEVCDSIKDCSDVIGDTSLATDVEIALENAKSRYKGVALKGIDALKLALEGYGTREIANIFSVPRADVTRWMYMAKYNLRRDDVFLREAGLV
jgi:RNA polymerase sigma factor (sigma-70 family)